MRSGLFAFALMTILSVTSCNSTHPTSYDDSSNVTSALKCYYGQKGERVTVPHQIIACIDSKATHCFLVTLKKSKQDAFAYGCATAPLCSSNGERELPTNRTGVTQKLTCCNTDFCNELNPNNTTEAQAHKEDDFNTRRFAVSLFLLICMFALLIGNCVFF